MRERGEKESRGKIFDGVSEDEDGKAVFVLRNKDGGLRRRGNGSKIQGKIGIKVAGLGGQNEHQFGAGSHEICM